MTHWDHGQAGSDDDERPATIARNARVGMILFVIYLVFYTGFVLISAFAPQVMAARPWAGVNLAIWSGFGLLGGALLMSLVYSWLCRGREAS